MQMDQAHLDKLPLWEQCRIGVIMQSQPCCRYPASQEERNQCTPAGWGSPVPPVQAFAMPSEMLKMRKHMSRTVSHLQVGAAQRCARPV